MITGKNTNLVYFSNLLQADDRFSGACTRIIRILDRYGVKSKFIYSTKDIWCRDYMPIQLEKERFVQFRYEPSYLKDNLEYQSNIKQVCNENFLNPIVSNINLDGGNVVNWSDRAIVSDRIFTENPKYLNKSQLICELENLLEVEVIVIPQINSDLTGHADGMVRFLNKHTLIGNSLDQEYAYWKKGMIKTLKDHNIEYIDVPFFEHKDKVNKHSAIGCYVNYLEIGELILLPIFEIKGNMDTEVLNLFKTIFPERIIETININEIGIGGGLLNCISWTIKK